MVDYNLVILGFLCIATIYLLAHANVKLEIKHVYIQEKEEKEPAPEVPVEIEKPEKPIPTFDDVLKAVNEFIVGEEEV